MNNSSNLSSHFGSPFLTPAPIAGEAVWPSPIEQRFEYINCLSQAVTVVMRTGLKLTLHPHGTLSSNQFIARHTLILHPSVKVHLQRLLSAVDENSSAELKLMRESYLQQISARPHWDGVTFKFDYPLSLQQIKAMGGVVYYHELDLVVSILTPEDTPPHPYSLEGRQQNVVQGTAAAVGDAGFAYTISLVDNGKKHGDRYINIGGNVYRITPTEDPTQRDGIYVVSNAASAGGYALQERIVKHYPFDGADESLGLYLTAEDAAVLGDASAARKKELADMEHQLNVEKIEAVQVKVKAEKEVTKAKEDLARAEHDLKELSVKMDRERAREEAERQRLKDFYEMRSMDRKDSSESFKFIPAVIMGIGAVFLAFKSLVLG